LSGTGAGDENPAYFPLRFCDEELAFGSSVTAFDFLKRGD
jgi:hypothetical protein